ncbi:cupin domain-containing protein [Auraticoccus monumenti]|uniref:Cupin superfamily protein n=1 Tax=Auraticoccus monumenti TaxID=675864 RepID=A0A1G7DXE0_9ACTN|nr:cupin domain-containing protein [Auraticoccus monumenti]SDE56138.1 Cupin superfamily protein [Auraticoccus monumenti]
MTQQQQTQDPALTEGGVLGSLVDVHPEEFASAHWAQRPLVSRGRDLGGDRLFGSAAVDELISRRGLRTPFLRVAKDGATLPNSSFTAPGGVGASIGDQLDDTALWRHLEGGATLVLQALHRTWDPVGELCSRLAHDLGHPVQANAYITPPQNRGFSDHYDVHDVFVLQVEGSKRWIIHEPVHPDPLRDQPWTDRRAAVEEAARGEAVVDTVLEPGDVLYLPRGWLHAAEAQGAVSIHLTLGVHIWTRFAVAEQLVQAALRSLQDDPAMRATLPLGPLDVAAEVDRVRERLTAALTDADPAPALRRTQRSQTRPAPLGPLAQLATLQDLQDDTAVRLRPALDARLVDATLTSRVTPFPVGAEETDAVERLLTGQVRTVADLGHDLARRLLRAGILVPG